MEKKVKAVKKKVKTQRPELAPSEAGRPARNSAAVAAKLIPANSGKRLGKGNARGR